MHTYQGNGTHAFVNILTGMCVNVLHTRSDRTRNSVHAVRQFDKVENYNSDVTQ